jgi:hypothetical protein
LSLLAAQQPLERVLLGGGQQAISSSSQHNNNNLRRSERPPLQEDDAGDPGPPGVRSSFHDRPFPAPVPPAPPVFMIVDDFAMDGGGNARIEVAAEPPLELSAEENPPPHNNNGEEEGYYFVKILNINNFKPINKLSILIIIIM